MSEQLTYDAYENFTLHESILTRAFYAKVTAHQAYLDTTAYEKISSEKQLSMLADLDSICPFYGEEVFMNGQAVVAEVDEDDEYIGDEVINTKGNAISGVHSGMAIIEDPENNKRYLFVHQLQLPHEPETLGRTRVRFTQDIAYFNMNTSITFLNDLEEALAGDREDSGINEDWQNLLMSNEKNIQKVVCSTKFRRMNKKAQQIGLEALLIKTEKETGLVDSKVTILAGYGYVQLNETTDRQLDIFEIGNEDVHGSCLGFFSLDLLKTSISAIRTNRDRPDILAGLCMIIDPDLETRQALDLEHKQTILIPLGQNLICEIND